MPTQKRKGLARRARANDPPLLILTSLASGAKHGYSLLQDIEVFADVQLGPGTLYGAIGRLEERGWIESLAAAGRTRPYQLTPAGREALEEMLGELSAIVDEAAIRLRKAPRLTPAGSPA
jgi:DNA-binding PadR family transcriptional regulator